jgi:hypothetical protein
MIRGGCENIIFTTINLRKETSEEAQAMMFVNHVMYDEGRMEKTKKGKIYEIIT